MNPVSSRSVAQPVNPLRSTERDFMKINNEFLSHVVALPPAATAAYLALVDLVRDTPGQTLPIGGAKLAARAGICVRTLRRVEPLLVAHRLIALHHTLRSNRYTLLKVLWLEQPTSRLARKPPTRSRQLAADQQVQSVRGGTPESVRGGTPESVRGGTLVVKDLKYMKTLSEEDKYLSPSNFAHSAAKAAGLSEEQVRVLVNVVPPEDRQKMAHWSPEEWRDAVQTVNWDVAKAMAAAARPN